MKTEIIDALKALKKPGIEWNKATKTYDDIDVSPTVIERDGKVLVSAEDGLNWADYYGEFSGGMPFIDKRLEEFATAHGMYWEWESPGAIYLCQA
jgi:hypothetical protein